MTAAINQSAQSDPPLISTHPERVLPH